MKKQALGYLGFYFYEIVVSQAKDKSFKPSLGGGRRVVTENSKILACGK